MYTAHELIGFMSPDLARGILDSAYANDKELYKATLAAVAQARKLRPVFLEKQPRPERHASMLTWLSRQSMEPAASGLLRGWLLRQHKPVLTGFLNALGIPNEDGVVENLPDTMDDARLKAAIDGALAQHPREVVVVYLHAFYQMNEATWPNLKQMLETDPRLQLGT